MNRNERLIIREMLRLATEAGWQLEILDDGDHHNVVRGKVEEAIEIANNLEECKWLLHCGKERGWVYTIFANGNDGLDVISDHTVNLLVYPEGLAQADDPNAQRNPIGFMEQVTTFTNELEAYHTGFESYKAEPSRKYALRDRVEMNAQLMLEHVLEFVREHGRRHGDADQLLPAEQQDLTVAHFMRLLDRIGVSAK